MYLFMYTSYTYSMFIASETYDKWFYDSLGAHCVPIAPLTPLAWKFHLGNRPPNKNNGAL